MKNLDQRLDEALAGLPSDDIPTSGEQTMNSIEIITWSNTQDGNLSLLKNNPNTQGPGISYIVFGQGDFKSGFGTYDPIGAEDSLPDEDIFGDYKKKLKWLKRNVSEIAVAFRGQGSKQEILKAFLDRFEI